MISMVNVDSIDSRFKDLVEFASNKFLPLSASDDHALSTISMTFTVKNVFAAKLSLTNPRFRSCRGYRSRASRGRYFEASDRGG